MQFLVQIQVNLPADMAPDELADVLTREQARGWELKKAGLIVRMWRIPGRRANVGIWQAANTDELHDALTSLPVFPWCDVRVTALATHYLEGGEAPR